MSEKSYVSLGKHICPICAAKHDSNEILLDKRLKNSMEKETITGWKSCPDCVDKLEKDYTALVIIDETKSEEPYEPSSVYRTGDILWIKKPTFAMLFNIPESEKVQDMSFGNSELRDKLTELFSRENLNKVH